MTKIVFRPRDYFHPVLELQPGQRGGPTFAFSLKGYQQASRSDSSSGSLFFIRLTGSLNSGGSDKPFGVLLFFMRFPRF